MSEEKKKEYRGRDLTGMRFGMLVVKFFYSREIKFGCNKYKWECVCDCGKTTIVEGCNLVSKNSKSCGCLRGKPRASRGIYSTAAKVARALDNKDKKTIYWDREDKSDFQPAK